MKEHKEETDIRRPRGNKRYALILAAGKSTRFKSLIPKVVHSLCGKPLVVHVLDKLENLGIEKTFVVVSRAHDLVKHAVDRHGVDCVVQDEPLGTGHAVMAAIPSLKEISGSLLVLSGDTPMIRSETLKRLLETRERQNADQVLLTAAYEDPQGYGRIIRDEKDEAVDIVEEQDATPEQKAICEINTGIICFKINSLLNGLSRLSRSNAAQEYYLTDLLRIFRSRGQKVVTIESEHPHETRGINNREELSLAESRLRAEITRRWMLEGVSILHPSSVFIDESVILSPDTLIYPGVVIEGNSKIGRGCVIYSFCHLKDVVLEEEVTVDHCSVVRNSVIGKKTRIGPFAHLRENTVIGSSARIGNFVEVKKSQVGDETKAAHLSYLGDSEIGAQVNIGAGTITCNFDGVQKNKTIIEDQVFTGSNSQLVAPLTLHKGAYVAAGSTITEDVPENALAIARSQQINKKGWAKKRKKNQRTKEQKKREQ